MGPPKMEKQTSQPTDLVEVVIPHRYGSFWSKRPGDPASKDPRKRQDYDVEWKGGQVALVTPREAETQDIEPYAGPEPVGAFVAAPMEQVPPEKGTKGGAHWQTTGTVKA